MSLSQKIRDVFAKAPKGLTTSELKRYFPRTDPVLVNTTLQGLVIQGSVIKTTDARPSLRRPGMQSSVYKINKNWAPRIKSEYTEKEVFSALGLLKAAKAPAKKTKHNELVKAINVITAYGLKVTT